MLLLMLVLINYHREGNFRQLKISYFKFTFGFNFHIVWYHRMHYSTVPKFLFGFNFRVRISIYENKIHTKKPAL